MSVIENVDFYHFTDLESFELTGGLLIHFLAAQDDVAALTAILENEGPRSILMTDFQGNSFLHYAAASDSINVAEHFTSLPEFANGHFINSHGITPAHIAAQRGNVKMLKALDQNTHILNDLSLMNWSPLHFAVYCGKTEAVKFLVSKDNSERGWVNSLVLGLESSVAFLPHRSCRFFSPLDLALAANHEEIAQILLENGGLPCLHAAVVKHNLQAVFYHVKGVGKGQEPGGLKKQTPLHVAARNGFRDIVHFFLECKFSTDVVDDDGLSPLELAVCSNSPPTVSELAAQSKSEHVNRALFLAADLGRAEVVKALLESSELRLAVASDGDPLLVRLIKRGLFGVAEEVLKGLSSVNGSDVRHATVTHYAACSGLESLLWMTMAKGGSKELDVFGMTPLFYATLSGDAKMSGMLTSQEDMHKKCDFGFSAFVVDAVIGELESLPFDASDLAGTYDIDLEQLKTFVDTFELKPCQVRTGSEVVDCQVLKMIDPKIAEKLSNLHAPYLGTKIEKASLLHLAVLFNCSYHQFVKILNTSHDLVDSVDSEGRSPLHWALLLGNAKLARELIKEMGNLDRKDVHGNTIFHMIGSDACEAVLQALLDQVLFNPKDFNDDHQSVFHALAGRNCPKCLLILSKACEDHTILSMPDNFGKQPLDYALESGGLPSIQLLHIVGVENRLVTAVAEGNLERVKELVESGYPISTTSAQRDGMTPLHVAAATKNLEIVKYLLEHGAELNILAKEKCPIHIAASAGDPKVIVEMLRTSAPTIAMKPEKQPFQLATNSECKLLLYNHWKRATYTASLVRQLECMDAQISLLKGFIHLPQLLEMSSFLEKLVIIVDHFDFVRKCVISAFEKGKRPDAFSISVHHYFWTFLTIDISAYCISLQDNYQTLLNMAFTKPLNNPDVIILTTYPIGWVTMIQRSLECLKPHLMSVFDDMSIMQQIFTVMHQQTLLATNLMGLLTKSIGERLSNFIDAPYLLQCDGVLDLHCDGRLTRVVNKVFFVYEWQFMEVIQKFFKGFVLPRSIPFQIPKMQHVRALVYSDYILFISMEKSDIYFKMPKALCRIEKAWANDKDKCAMRITTPVGLMEFRPTRAVESIRNFWYVLNARKYEQDPNNQGELAFQTEKLRTFRCLIAYLPEKTSTSLSLRTIIVRAGRPSECNDLCTNHMVDVLGSAPPFMKVQKQEITDFDDDLITI